MATPGNRWLQAIEQNPDHSSWYIERFRKMAAEGADLDGEARLIDAMVPRGSRVLDAGCGPGRLAGTLHRAGHRVVGVDLDPALIAAAEEDHPGPTFLVGDLADLNLAGQTDPAEFDVIVSAGNVMTFLDPGTRGTVVDRLAAHLALAGRLVVGFGAGRGYGFDEFASDVARAGLVFDLRLSTWDLRPFTPSSEFMVAVLSSAAGGSPSEDA